MPSVYIRIYHKVGQRPEADTSGPFTVSTLSHLSTIWSELRSPIGFRAERRGEHRLEDGGAVFFLAGAWHSAVVMEVGSALHRRHAPASHFFSGGTFAGAQLTDEDRAVLQSIIPVAAYGGSFHLGQPHEILIGLGLVKPTDMTRRRGVLTPAGEAARQEIDDA